MTDDLTSGLGPHACALCLGEIEEGALVATKGRFEWHGTFEHGRCVKVADDYAHAECALDSHRDGWVIEVTREVPNGQEASH